MSSTLGHLPHGFVKHRPEIAADAAGVPTTAKLCCRGYEKVLVYIDPDVVGGTATLELYIYDETHSIWISKWTQAAADRVGYEVSVFGGDVIIAARAFGGGATKVSVYVGGITPERSFGN